MSVVFLLLFNGPFVLVLLQYIQYFFSLNYLLQASILLVLAVSYFLFYYSTLNLLIYIFFPCLYLDLFYYGSIKKIITYFYYYFVMKRVIKHVIRQTLLFLLVKSISKGGNYIGKAVILLHVALSSLHL